ncbi:DUF3139 domain-containing protein [Paenibacillus sp. GCM10023248]|uniref:DUF3139 domain-containing protein n=1 Tax=unclassified Paenibacillus TaxID=185978 RepID=UPI002378B78A|nr:DUF3139 domain-containing protein [Paenibacillus sp. MAHUQ-63]MDD9266192.1 DUF3139 domain-containing protein [Paenibacillus sp. MAHUQ-63]
MNGTTKKRITISIVIFILLIILSIFVKIRFDIYQHESKMHDYLISKGYKEEEILKINCELSILPKYPVYVTFKDEPDHTYLYSYSATSGWFQFPPQGEYDPRKFKHLETK